jgi:hypothetical protein
MWQQSVLLGFVEAMQLIDKQQGAFAIPLTLGAGFCDHAANLIDPSQDGAEGDEVGPGLGGDYPGQRGFAGARGAPENH